MIHLFPGFRKNKNNNIYMNIKRTGKQRTIGFKKRTFKNRLVNENFEKEIVIKLLSLLNNIKLYHWKTKIYATHKATDELYGKLNDNIDRFIEVLLGKIGNRINLFKVNSIPIRNIETTEDIKREINYYKSYFVGLNNNKFMKQMTNSDLFTIRDEILADLNQFLYLLTFNSL